MKEFSESFYFDLSRLSYYDLRAASEALDLSGDANLFSRERFKRFFELAPVRSPDDGRKNLVGIGLVEIQKSGLPPAAKGIMRAGHRAADRLLLADEFGGLFWGDGLLGESGGR